MRFFAASRPSDRRSLRLCLTWKRRPVAVAVTTARCLALLGGQIAAWWLPPPEQPPGLLPGSAGFAPPPFEVSAFPTTGAQETHFVTP
jgi:hypothetical protein